MSSVVSAEKTQKRKDREEEKNNEEGMIEQKKAPEDSGSVF
jgi:hypothetical protein